jgi:DNA-directed RNA polymerase subunit RPC12/RpoP
MGKLGFAPEFIERNNEIMAMASYGTFTLQQIGDEFGLTRERVRQIWVGLANQSWKELRHKAREDRRNKLLDRTKFLCRACGKKVTYREPYRRWLCAKCWGIIKIEQRDPYTTLACDYCSLQFHPLRVRKYSRKISGKYGNFCTAKCYWNYLKEKDDIEGGVI